MDEQEQWNEEAIEATKAKLRLPTKGQLRDLINLNAADGLALPKALTSDLIKRVMTRHGFSRTKALEMIEAFGG